MANTKKRWTADEIEILRKYYPAEGDQVCERLYRMMLNMSDYGQRQRIKYSESIMLRRAVRYVIA